MRVFAAFLLSVLLACTAAIAQVGLPWPGPGGVASGGGGGGSRPLDVAPSAAAAWGLRALSGTWADGSHLSIRVKRASDSEICDVLINSSGDLGNTVAGSGAACAHAATAIATWCNATTCAIETWYDQSGNSRDALLSSANHEAALTFSPTTGDFTVGGGSTSGYCTSGTASVGQPASASAVYQVTSQTTQFNTFLAFDPGPSQFGSEKSGNANQVFTYAGTSVVDAASTINSYHAGQALFNGASSKIVIDGSSSTVNPGAGSGTAAALCFGNGGSGNNPYQLGMLREGIIWAADESGHFTAINSNQHTYWGF